MMYSGMLIRPGIDGTDRSFICERCQRRFTRRYAAAKLFASLPCYNPTDKNYRDVLKRHLTTCKADESNYFATPAQTDWSSRPALCQACDRCQKHKRLCNFNQPCHSCLATNEACIYSWRSSSSHSLGFTNDVSVDEISDVNLVLPTFEELPTTLAVSRLKRDPKIAFEFLINFTTAIGFASSFDNDLSFHRRQERYGSSYSNAGVSRLKYIGESCTQQVSLDRSLLVIPTSETDQLRPTHVFGYPVRQDGFEVRRETSNLQAQPLQPTFSEHWLPWQQYYRPGTLALGETKSLAHALRWNSDPLTLKAIEIVSRIKEAIILKPRNSAIPFHWSVGVEETCLRFFCPLNLHKFIGLYWISWYPHWPVIHKPTFIASAAPCTLLAAMVLIGASYSTDLADRDNSRMWFNAVEEMIFGDEYFCDSPEMITECHMQQGTIPRRRLQTLQAAHAICLCQVYEGDEVSKRRARHHRCNAVVAVSSEGRPLLS